ncbi:hypothetical protein [Sediminibacterium sp.]|nr:hypothetical protein [Sediminibacterium sp.]
MAAALKEGAVDFVESELTIFRLQESKNRGKDIKPIKIVRDLI